MNSTALKTVYDLGLLSRGDSVIAAVSGGADSMALLCFLLEIKEEFSLSIYVCHLNHLLRGDDAERDQKFVEDFCKKHSIPFFLKRVDVSSVAKKEGLGFEECARNLRYEFFCEVAASISKDAKIATAHTLSDSAETLIFNIARGAGASGAASIAPKRDNIIRPLIRCTREQVEEYLTKKNQAYCTDCTNTDTTYSRNYIRHKIIPLLKEINPSFETAVMNFTEIAREQNEFISEITEREYTRIKSEKGLLKSELLKANISLRSGIISRYLRENNVEVSRQRILNICSLLEENSFSLSVCKDGFIKLDGDFLFFEKLAEKSEPTDFEFKVVEGDFPLPDGRILKISKISGEEFEKKSKIFPKTLQNCVNCDIIDENFVIRNRKSGDFISLFSRNVTKTLKKLLNESKIETEKRDIIPMLACKNHVYWIDGIGVDRDAAANKDCESVFFFEVSEYKNGETK